MRIHWTGCPNSCGQVQAADIGLMGGPAKKMNAEGKMKAVPGVKMFLGGTIGEHGELQLDTHIEVSLFACLDLRTIHRTSLNLFASLSLAGHPD